MTPDGSSTSTPTAPARRKTTRWRRCRSKVFGDPSAGADQSNKSMIGHTPPVATRSAVFSVRPWHRRHPPTINYRSPTCIALGVVPNHAVGPRRSSFSPTPSALAGGMPVW
jgi:hypothetical protein